MFRSNPKRRLDTLNSSLGSDSEIEILSDQSGPRRKSDSPRKGKGKAKVVRNRSITPPPQISDSEIMEARNVVKCVVVVQPKMVRD